VLFAVVVEMAVWLIDASVMPRSCVSLSSVVAIVSVSLAVSKLPVFSVELPVVRVTATAGLPLDSSISVSNSSQLFVGFHWAAPPVRRLATRIKCYQQIAVLVVCRRAVDRRRGWSTLLWPVMIRRHCHTLQLYIRHSTFDFG